jgi:hypothetical protein
MTMTETASTKKATTRNGDSSPALVDQFVLSTAGVASQSLTNARGVAEGLLGATDTVVLGLLDVADELAQVRVLNDLTTRMIGVGRQAWNAVSATSREALERL